MSDLEQLRLENAQLRRQLRALLVRRSRSLEDLGSMLMSPRTHDRRTSLDQENTVLSMVVAGSCGFERVTQFSC